MAKIKNENISATFIGWTIFASLTLISPNITVDIVNPIKLLAITLGSGLTLYTLLQRKAFKNLNLSVLTLTLLIVLATTSSIVAANSFSENLFGNDGRAFGLLAFISSLFLCYAARGIASNESMNSITNKVFLAGGLASFYGLLQFLNLDPLEWNNSNSRIVGFLANPNFQSAFLGMVSGCSSLILIQRHRSMVVKLLVGLNIILSVFLIIKSDSQQGIMTFGVSLSTVFLLQVRYANQKFYVKGFVFLSFIAAFLISLLDILQKTPWKSFLYQPSVSFRGDYWRTGMEIIRENPTIGTGFNGYSTWYERARDFKSLSRTDANLVSDSAHNLFIDIGVIGGLPLLLSFIIFLLAAFIKIAKFKPLMVHDNHPYFLIIALWFSWLSYSIISPMQIALFCFGMVLTGLIIGYDTSANSTEVKSAEIKLRASTLPKNMTVAILVIASLMAVTTIPYLYKENLYMKSLQKKRVDLLEQALLSWPQNSQQLAAGSELMSKNGFNEIAEKFAMKATQISPENSRAWKVLTLLNNLSPEEKKKAIDNARKYDPSYQ